MDSKDIDLLYNLANCYRNQGRHKDAIAIEKKILEVENTTDQERACAHSGISVSFESQAEHDFAKKKTIAYEEALKVALEEGTDAVILDPSNILYLGNEAEILGKLGHNTDALGFLYKAAKLDVNNSCLAFI